MTRGEEIIKAARVYANGIAQHLPNKKYCEEDFIAGAKWADAHPKLVTIPLEEIENVAKDVMDKDWQARQDRLWTMIERNLRAKFICKACEWIERNYHATPMGGYYYLPEDCIKQFKQAMKGD